MAVLMRNEIVKDTTKWTYFSLNHEGQVPMIFNNIEELKAELENKGLPISLAYFDIDKYDEKFGHITNTYMDWSTSAYPD